MKKALFIFTRDFRLDDNTTLNYLCNKLNVTSIIPIFIFTKKQIDNNKYFSSNSVQLLCHGLIDLNETLNNKLNIFYGDTNNIISDIYEAEKFRYIAINKDITPFGEKRNQNISKWCLLNNVDLVSFCDFSLLDLELIKNGTGNYYKTFSHFNKKVIAYHGKIIKDIKKNIKPITWIKLDNIPDKIKARDMQKFYDNNENNAFLPFNRKKVLEKISSKSLEKFKDYSKMRKYTKYNTTLLSAFIKYGLVSVREVFKAIFQKFGPESELLRQIVWREYYYYLMYHLPINKTIGGGNFQDRDYAWENDKKYIEAWKKGETGFPFIDACMRQLNTTGWMHNSGRLSTANALVYLFLCDWKIGEKYFARKLADYDISQNNGNWQWCGGVGIDRKPYLRMYNYLKLSQKHDPDAEFIKKWIPQLKDVPATHINNWDKYHTSYLKLNYPQPIVDYHERRLIANEVFLKKN